MDKEYRMKNLCFLDKHDNSAYEICNAMIVLVNMFVVVVDVGIMLVGISDLSITGVHADHKLWRDI